MPVIKVANLKTLNTELERDLSNPMFISESAIDKKNLNERTMEPPGHETKPSTNVQKTPHKSGKNKGESKPL